MKIYFGIHKHMHQPYYNTTDRDYWDGEKDQIFGSRGGNYTDFVPAAVRQYVEAGLPHAGLSDQLERLADRAARPLRRARACAAGASPAGTRQLREIGDARRRRSATRAWTFAPSASFTR